MTHPDPTQLRGCLPAGFTLDSALTPEQFRTWYQVGRTWFWSRREKLKGVTGRSRKSVRIIPRLFLEGETLSKGKQ